jgi:cyclophilin family peptidyl-prolyl cis-trans isomerase
MLKFNPRIIILPALAIIGLASVACSSTPEAPPPPVAPPPIAPTAASAAVAPVPVEPPSTSPAAPSGVFSWDAAPAMEIDVNKSYTAVFELEKGEEFTVELYAKEAPNTVNSFVFLSRQGFYDGVTFHRVIEGFMAQGGDRNGNPLGTGGPGYKFDNEIHPDRHHDTAGTLSMANAGERNGSGTNGSQFFITFIPTPPLDGHGKNCSAPGTSCHTVFGRVVEGMDVVNNISIRDPNTARTPGDAIRSIDIIEK